MKYKPENCQDIKEHTVDQQLFNWAVAALGALGGFILKSIWDAVKELQRADTSLVEKVSSIEILIAGDYIKKEDFNSLSNIIFLKLDKIMEKLDSKVDK